MATLFVQAQSDETAEELLTRVASTYRTLKQFHFATRTVSITRSEGLEKTNDDRLVTAADGPRVRVEVGDPVLGGTLVFDGETTWIYLPRFQQYIVRRAASLDGGAASAGGGSQLAKMKDHVPGRYRDAAQKIKAARIVGEETVPLGQEEVTCKVVEAEYQPGPGVRSGSIRRRFWIDPDRAIVLREVSEANLQAPAGERTVELVETIEFEVARINARVSDDLFAFSPPEGAEKVESFQHLSGPERSLVGRPARDFTLEDLDGGVFRLAAQRGKVVLLNFWASWCAPCRVELPRIDALLREWRGRGLVVAGINTEPPEKAREFLMQQRYTFPTLTDPEQEATKKYLVTAIPTAIVIDREGNVAAYLVGAPAEEKLREVVQKALE